MDKQKEEFKHIVRISSVDLDGNKSVEYALQSIRGVGPRLACAVCEALGIDKREKLGSLTDERIGEIAGTIENTETTFPKFFSNHRNDFINGSNYHVVGSDHVTAVRDDIAFLRKIRCYRGIRHEKGLKLRGQRTKNNGRRGLAVGVSRKRLQQLQKKGGK